jgi:universal stress protein E
VKKNPARRPILVALRDLDRSARSTLRKAASLAKQRGVPVRIVHVLAIPHSAMTIAAASVRQAAAGELKDRQKDLMKLAAGPELRGIKTSVSVRRDYPIADALVREVLEHRPQLLIAQSHRHGPFTRLWLSNTDWELIRNCPCPLWLSKSNEFGRVQTVVAAVDPLHSHAKPAALDAVIVRHAMEAADGQPKRVVMFHSYSIAQPAAFDGTVEAFWIGMSPQEQQAYEAMLRKQIDRLRIKYDIPPTNVVIAPGDPVMQLPRRVKKSGAGLVVMGAVSRGGLQRLFIGHTAERVIDELTCDVLIVKPAGFKTQVARRVR